MEILTKQYFCSLSRSRDVNGSQMALVSRSLHSSKKRASGVHDKRPRALEILGLPIDNIQKRVPMTHIENR